MSSMPETVALRLARASDLELIARLELELFGADAWSRELVAAELAAPWTEYFVAVNGPASADAAGSGDAGSGATGPASAASAPEQLLGYAGVSVPARGVPADIQTIAVVPEARRRGVGRTLLLALAEAGQRRGAAEALLEVRADNPGAQALYRSMGFEQIAIRPRYYQPDDVDAIVMRAALPLSGGAP